MITCLRNKPYSESLAARNMFPREQRRLREKLIECFKMRKGFTDVDRSTQFGIGDATRTRNNATKLKRRQANRKPVSCMPRPVLRPRGTRLSTDAHKYSVQIPYTRVTQHFQSFIPFLLLVNSGTAFLYLLPPAYDLDSFTR